jgi:hypothetical protein
MAETQRQIDPRILEAAKDDGTLRRMIRMGAPLTREKWISMNWLGHPPTRRRASTRRKCRSPSSGSSTPTSPAVATRLYAILAAGSATDCRSASVVQSEDRSRPSGTGSRRSRRTH